MYVFVANKYMKDVRYMSVILYVLALVIGFVLLVKGSDFFVDGAAGIAGRFGIPQIIIGLTIVAMGTSAPEAAVSITAAFEGSADITIGNIVGSNILNVFIILGIASAITPIAVKPETIKIEIPFMILVSVVLFLLGLDGVIQLADGIILIVLFAAYLTYLAVQSKRLKTETSGDTVQKKTILMVIFLIGGLAAIIFGSRLVVYGASGIARELGISERFIGLTVVALGTSLPELFTSVTAARKGNADIAIGNIVGSNIFNILFVVGLTSLITAVPYQAKFIIDSAVMIVAAAVLWLFIFKTKKLGRAAGICMLIMYAGYFAYLCMG